jgi:osmotically-inducible protein OsmY
VWSTTVGGRPRHPHQRPEPAPGPHAGKGPRGYRRSDARILEEVSARLERDPDVDASGIEVTVEDGQVLLAGEVPERRMRWLAEEVALACAGVKDVDNRLRGPAPSRERSGRS